MARYIDYPTRLQGVELNQLRTGTILPYEYFKFVSNFLHQLIFTGKIMDDNLE
jgi:hypothetical protein